MGPYGLHASFLLLVGLPLTVPLPEKLKRKKGEYKIYPSGDPEGYTYQSSDPEGYTYQSSDPEGCTYQSSDPEGCTYQSSDPVHNVAHQHNYNTQNIQASVSIRKELIIHDGIQATTSGHRLELRIRLEEGGLGRVNLKSGQPRATGLWALDGSGVSRLGEVQQSALLQCGGRPMGGTLDGENERRVTAVALAGYEVEIGRADGEIERKRRDWRRGDDDEKIQRTAATGPC
ncbi:NBS-LRR type resistance protein [Cucumis melo var. makuwa]|uniref:NBS-LRR type resistance protein n=1 Tax=Cucumis melo var. makuwa TaxID=1194695 RepID=A0A5A7VJL4_CUCMM|nr:NBS-LRR type resistance protein [Cucumis melo var. makuwa]TYK06124.1 NBS-LRR type resistance protein [Cucumis melo var. makuwa]